MKAKIPHILIVGLGQLGSRYLQGLVSGNTLMLIDIVEPSEDSFGKGIEIVSSAVNMNTKVINRVSLDELRESYDVCIVATSAAPRARIIESIAVHTSVKNWVIEKVLAQSEQQLAQILAAVNTSEGAWVNTPRRRTSIYRKLKSQLDAAVPIKVQVNFPAMGLGCNSIHFIDVVSWLVESSVKEITIEFTEGWKPAKREGYSEFDGRMVVEFSDGSTLIVDSSSDALHSVTVLQGERQFTIDENKGITEGGCFNPGRIEYQSELSLPLIHDILEQKMGDSLPSVQESVQQHIQLFTAIRSCMALQLSIEASIPIT